MSNKLVRIIKDAFTKDIGYQPFIDGFAVGFPRVNLGQLKTYYSLFKGEINPSDLGSYVKSINYHYDKVGWDNWTRAQYIAGCACSFPFNTATWILTSPGLAVGMVGFAASRIYANLTGQKIEQEGFTFPDADMKL